MSKRRWSDLGPAAKAAVVVAGAAQIALLGAALDDLRRRDAEHINGPRWAWGLASLVNFVGPIAYFVFGRRGGRAAAGSLD